MTADSNGDKGSMTARSALFIGVGAMVGAGIFALLGQAGAIAGSVTWLSFLFAGVISLFVGYSFVKLGLRYRSGGRPDRLPAGEVRVGSVYGWLSLPTLLAGIITLAMAALTFGSYGATIFAGQHHAIPCLWRCRD